MVHFVVILLVAVFTEICSPESIRPTNIPKYTDSYIPAAIQIITNINEQLDFIYNSTDPSNNSSIKNTTLFQDTVTSGSVNISTQNLSSTTESTITSSPGNITQESTSEIPASVSTTLTSPDDVNSTISNMVNFTTVAPTNISTSTATPINNSTSTIKNDISISTSESNEKITSTSQGFDDISPILMETSTFTDSSMEETTSITIVASTAPTLLQSNNSATNATILETFATENIEDESMSIIQNIMSMMEELNSSDSSVILNDSSFDPDLTVTNSKFLNRIGQLSSRMLTFFLAAGGDVSDERLELIGEVSIRNRPMGKSEKSLADLRTLLVREAKRQALSRYQGFTNEVIQDLAESSKLSAADQLKTVLETILNKSQLQRTSTKTKAMEIVEELKTNSSSLREILVDVKSLDYSFSQEV